jgi:hypothetical protein
VKSAPSATASEDGFAEILVRMVPSRAWGERADKPRVKVFVYDDANITTQ